MSKAYADALKYFRTKLSKQDRSLSRCLARPARVMQPK